ncbi:MAG: GntR family transcriptional regulator [Parvularculaceae bacterium]
MTLANRQPERPGFRPLYQQVRELLLARIASGVWRPAEALPSEQTLASELGVSHGTVRKALDSLAADNLVERRQGKGTYVVEHTQESAHFRFFKISYPTGERAMPSCRKASITERLAKSAERQRLGLGADARVFQIKRDRHIDGAVAVREVIVISADLFRGLDKRQPLPNTLYTLYQSEFGVSIVSASEQILAIAAGREDAEALGIAPGAPILEINRTAYDITGRAIELRQSRFATDTLVYAVELR